VQLNLVLSFDHELHLGGWDSFRSDLFEPTDALLDCAIDADVPLVFFTDVFCAVQFREWDPKNFLEPYIHQLHRMLREGHEVQPHFHPHWLDSRFDSGTYHPSASFSFAALELNGGPQIEHAVRIGMDFLRSVCRQATPTFNCLAYRAGGYNLDPQARVLRALYDEGIRIDSSVMKGYRFSSRHSLVDYTQCHAAPQWTFALQGPVTKRADTDFWEIPIACVPRNWLTNIPYLVRRVLYRTRAPRPRGVSFHDVGRTAYLAKLRRLFPNDAMEVSFDLHTHSPKALLRMLEHYVDRHQAYPAVCSALCSHPKNMDTYNRQLMVEFVKRVRDRFKESVRFLTFAELHRTLSSHRP
jgi:hypothetical protein